MTTKEALQTMAIDARRRATYFQQRAGRREEGERGVAVPIAEPSERARAERIALAFLGAADVIQKIADDGKWP